jgi:hypothetical protein
MSMSCSRHARPVRHIAGPASPRKLTNAFEKAPDMLLKGTSLGVEATR